MTLVDTSVWIDFFVGCDSEQVKTLEQLIQSDSTIVVCGVVLTEVLQGISNDKQHQMVKDYLAPLIRLTIDEEVWMSAADIYRSLRRKGITIRKTNDCVIAATALQHNCCLLHNDRDFDAIEKYYPLKTQCLPVH